MRKISFVIPCYASEKTIASVVSEIEGTISGRADYDYEIILINDCSPDNVWREILCLSKNNDKIRGISFAKNFGQHSALMAGYRLATGDIIISLDDDGQTPADELYSLVDKLDEGYDVVYASYENKRHSKFRNLGSSLNNYMCEKLLGKPKGLMVTSYFAMRDFVCDEICKYENPYTYVIGLVLRTTNNIATVPVKHRDRKVGQSGYSLPKLLGLWMNGFTAFSVIPLRLASLTGMALAFLGFLYVVYIIINKISNPDVPMGWSSTGAIILIVGGVVLCVLGMLGEYLGRVYISLNKSPQYVIRDTTVARKSVQSKMDYQEEI